MSREYEYHGKPLDLGISDKEVLFWGFFAEAIITISLLMAVVGV